VGAFWLLAILGYDLSVAVWVGIIALAGVSTEIGVILVMYLNESLERHRLEGRLNDRADLLAAVRDGAVRRVRPIMMTVTAIIASLLPIMWSQGSGADVMKRIAAPMVGGMVTTTLLGLLVLPALYFIWRGHRYPRTHRRDEGPPEPGGGPGE
jgi:Cu(I)/Ag(I) efflux system membrane protein CusA/SilA